MPLLFSCTVHVIQIGLFALRFLQQGLKKKCKVPAFAVLCNFCYNFRYSLYNYIKLGHILILKSSKENYPEDISLKHSNYLNEFINMVIYTCR